MRGSSWLGQTTCRCIILCVIYTDMPKGISDQRLKVPVGIGSSARTHLEVSDQGARGESDEDRDGGHGVDQCLELGVHLVVQRRSALT